MIKRTLYFSNPAYLFKKNNQLVVKEMQDEKKENTQVESRRNVAKEIFNTVPIEDIGIVVLDNHQITITHGLLAAL